MPVSVSVPYTNSLIAPLRGFASSQQSHLNTSLVGAQSDATTPAAIPAPSQATANANVPAAILPGVLEHGRNVPNSTTAAAVVTPPALAVPYHPPAPVQTSGLPGITQQQLTDALTPLLTQLLSNLQAPAPAAANLLRTPVATSAQTGMFLRHYNTSMPALFTGYQHTIILPV
jgi:hypothetical protein